MNKRVFYLILVMLMTAAGCSDFARTVTNSIDGLGLTPDYAKGMTANDLNQMALENQKLDVPSIAVGNNIPEGELTERYENGSIKFKTVVKNRCFDKYMDIYYPNGKLRTHTLLVNCKANGISFGYTSSGVLHTEIPYVDGLADGNVKVYDDTGKVISNAQYVKGYPVKK